MTLTLKGLSKNGKTALYTGGSHVFRFQKAAFINETPSAIMEIEGDLKTSTAKVPMTAEERKAARAAKPKPTLAEKIAARQAALDKLLKQQAVTL